MLLAMKPTPSLSDLTRLLAGRAVVALVGAGCSTDSGIPDYRGASAPSPPRKPMMFKDFRDDSDMHRRYWARSFVGWPRIAEARPNAAHVALAHLEAAGSVVGVISQNVDGLHQAAGTRRLVELHGSLHRVACLGCGRRTTRADLQDRMATENPLAESGATDDPVGGRVAPDGDADVDPSAEFHVPCCLACGGMLKPDVVFFGENVPRPVVDSAWAAFDRAEVLLVLGSSLTVFSGFRFVRRAAKNGIPVGILNLGPTRGDDLATVRVEAPLGHALPHLARALPARPHGDRARHA